ncbi:MAG: ABC transporter permease [Alphaproteobacteria bacterium]|nr:ABC transporter permease [Alphaproteobacteria bacterium]
MKPRAFIGLIPFALALAAWAILPLVVDYPSYMLPPLPEVWVHLGEIVGDGSLAGHIVRSLGRLALGFMLGVGLAVPLGIAIALNRHVADTLKPLLTFLQSIAGIAWVPLAIIWFGIGIGSVVFVIANTIFFATLYNTIVGVQAIPQALHRAVRSLGGRGAGLATVLILPGALVQLIVGFRTAMAYGWRALVAGEMIAGTNGLGYMTIEAVQWYRTETVLLGMIAIGLIWLAMDRLVFVPVERATVQRWGIVQR